MIGLQGLSVESASQYLQTDMFARICLIRIDQAVRPVGRTGQPVSTGMRLVSIPGQPVATGWSDSNPSTALALITRYYRLLLPDPLVQ